MLVTGPFPDEAASPSLAQCVRSCLGLHSFLRPFIRLSQSAVQVGISPVDRDKAGSSANTKLITEMGVCVDGYE